MGKYHRYDAGSETWTNSSTVIPWAAYNSTDPYNKKNVFVGEYYYDATGYEIIPLNFSAVNHTIVNRSYGFNLGRILYMAPFVWSNFTPSIE